MAYLPVATKPMLIGFEYIVAENTQRVTCATRSSCLQIRRARHASTHWPTHTYLSLRNPPGLAKLAESLLTQPITDTHSQDAISLCRRRGLRIVYIVRKNL